MFNWGDVPGAAAYLVERNESWEHGDPSAYRCVIERGTEKCVAPVRVVESADSFVQPHSKRCRYRFRTILADGSPRGCTGWVVVRGY